MKNSLSVSALLVAIALSSSLSTAYADSSAANCELRKDGEEKEGRSGSCTFSQRQGYIDLKLHNGTTYSLSPGEKPDHYKDQNGHKVVRTQAGGDTQEFKWEDGKKLRVTFGGSKTSHTDMTKNPEDLQDLVNGKRVGGEVDDELVRRGWSRAKDEVQGKEVYSYWGKGSRCVVVHFNASRHVKSIANGMESSCK